MSALISQEFGSGKTADCLFKAIQLTQAPLSDDANTSDSTVPTDNSLDFGQGN